MFELGNNIKIYYSDMPSVEIRSLWNEEKNTLQYIQMSRALICACAQTQPQNQVAENYLTCSPHLR